MRQQFKIGDEVYLKTDIYQLKRMITGYVVRGESHVIYYVACGLDESTHYAIELSTEVDTLLKVTNG